MEIAGLATASVAGVAIAVIGALYLLKPRMMAATFGLPTLPQEEATAWLRLKGVRDLATGLVAGALLLTAPPIVTGWALLAFTLIPLGDATIILSARGNARAAWSIHGTTAAVMLVGVALLLST